MSKVDFISVKFNCEEEFKDILVAELDALGYNSMLETDEGVDGYIEVEAFDEHQVADLIEKYSAMTRLTYVMEEVQSRNWNEEWEKNYDPIVVDDRCLVRATFHTAEKTYPYEIVINPKMSFGTGHHATTYLMLKLQMELDHNNKRVLDAGCGTAILAIMAEKLGAREVIAYDNNSWSTENAPENIALNNSENISVLAGTINTIDVSGEFDIILANINKNVLLEEMKAYQSYLPTGANLALSGFYESDEPDIIKEAGNYGLHLMTKESRNYWSALLFEKK